MNGNDLSERLLAVADMTREAVEAMRDSTDTEESSSDEISIVDIGTDHAYLPIYLAARGTAAHVIAVDVNEGPLSRARKNVEAAGLSDRIDTRISDGFDAIKPGEAGVAVIAGMGGRLMQKIIGECDTDALGITEMVLQPQSEVKELWSYLTGSGWAVVDERMVFEDGKFYTMFRAEREGEQKNNPKAAENFGSILLDGRDETYKLFLEKELECSREILENLMDADGHEERITELTQKNENIEVVLAAYDNASKVQV